MIFMNMSEGYLLDISGNDQTEYLSAAEYQQYLTILPSLGHAGEGHPLAVELENGGAA